MFGDIAGFVLVTILLIMIDSYILCEHQNTARIIFSIGIDYAILVVYIAARNVAMISEPSVPSRTQPEFLQTRTKQQDCK